MIWIGTKLVDLHFPWLNDLCAIFQTTAIKTIDLISLFTQNIIRHWLKPNTTYNRILYDAIYHVIEALMTKLYKMWKIHDWAAEVGYLGYGKYIRQFSLLSFWFLPIFHKFSLPSSSKIRHKSNMEKNLLKMRVLLNFHCLSNQFKLYILISILHNIY